ncbi:MAG: response regulator [Anaerolineae bacterium]|nr:response regulator [Anaerolineae bacterium]
MSKTTPTPAQEKPTIVCIDDEPEMLRLIHLTLGRRNFELATAVGGREGLELVRKLKPQLVLLDLMLPDLDGWSVYQQMKIDEELKNIPVIIVTAKDRSIDRLLGLHIAKVDDYITKPFGPRELLDSINKALGIES